MKPLHVVGLLTVFLLACLFFYVLEDVPSFGDPHSPANERVLLSKINASPQIINELNEGVVPEVLRSELEKRGFYAEELSVMHKGDHYDIYIPTNESEFNTKEPEVPFYLVVTADDAIEIYRYAPAVRYEERVEEECGVPNMVTAVLADYRGYDTLGETTVIFTACVAVILLLRRYGRL